MIYNCFSGLIEIIFRKIIKCLVVKCDGVFNVFVVVIYNIKNCFFEWKIRNEVLFFNID